MHYIFRLRAVMGNIILLCMKNVVARTTMILFPTLLKSKCISRKFGVSAWLKTLLKCFVLGTHCVLDQNF